MLRILEISPLTYEASLLECLNIDFLTDISTFLYDESVVDVVEELYVADTTVLEPPVYEEMVEDFTVEM
jgi:hypothetical protein